VSKRKRRSVRPHVWHVIRDLRAKGYGWEDIRRKLKAKYPEETIPTTAAMRVKAFREGWAEPVDEEIIEKTQEVLADLAKEERHIKTLLGRHGCTDTERMRILAKGMLDKDKRIALMYLQEYHRLIGAYAPQKKSVDHTSGGEKIDGPRIYLPDNGRNKRA